MTLATIEECLRAALERPLPGIEAQLLLAPRPRPGWHAGSFPDDSRRAAGLMLLFPRGDEPHLVLTVRARGLTQHGGQVSLPGGAVDADETVEHAALREAREEIGIDPAAVVVLGRLTPLHIPVSGFVLHPVIGICTCTPTLQPAESEVERILEIPIQTLLDPERLRSDVRIHGGVEYHVPYFAVVGYEVWGATAMVLAEFVWLLGYRPGSGLRIGD